jgi:hypothetical protein
MVKEISLTQGQVALVDDEDFERVNQYKWNANYHKLQKQHYAERGIHICRINGKTKTKTIRMHRFIMDAPKGKSVDHINHNTLDNRKENLRIVSHRENHQNRKNKGASKYPGVCFDKRRGTWYARIRIGKRCNWLGSFDDEKDAARAYQNAYEQLKRDGYE